LLGDEVTENKVAEYVEYYSWGGRTWADHHSLVRLWLLLLLWVNQVNWNWAITFIPAQDFDIHILVSLPDCFSPHGKNWRKMVWERD